MVISYNHERYIAQALDSILRQKRDFEIEINVIDDASTDGTQAIVRGYRENYPGIVNCYFNDRNAGHIATQLNTIRGFQTLRGQYFALLEGDDYWTDEEKLATQVAFLDAHEDFVACAHYTMKVFDDNSRPPEHFLPFIGFGRSRSILFDLICMSAVYHLSSIVYRNVFGVVPPLCLSDPYSCEITINMTYGTFGDFFCLDQYMSAYRVHESGVFSRRSQERIWLFHLYGYMRFALYLGPRHWMKFVRAVFKFSRYVLAAPKNGIVPGLEPRTRLIFLSHIIAVWPAFFVDSFVRNSRRAFRRSWKAAKALIKNGEHRTRRLKKKSKKLLKNGRRAIVRLIA